MRAFGVGLAGLWLVAAGSAGCGSLAIGDDDPQSVGLPPMPTPPKRPVIESDYKVPWACGQKYYVTQGNDGDMCDRHDGDHVAVQNFAWDFALPRHTPVLASRAGTVTVAKNVVKAGERCYDGCPGAFGSGEFAACCSACLLVSNRVNVEHGDGSVATYWHLDVATVSVGQRIKAGEVLGYSGTSGCSTGPHLHFQVMGACATGWCQSRPVWFVEGGAPGCGERIVSLNCQ